MNESRENWLPERGLLNGWALWCLRDDSRTILRLCGLTWAGSQSSRIGEIYDRGARSTEDVVGYARELPPAPDHLIPTVDEFMGAVTIIIPEAASAILARHRRMIRGKLELELPEWRLAEALYGRKRSVAWEHLATDCRVGYAALRRWLAAEQPGLKTHG
ncbi:MAG: hypothetical protein ACRETA_01175 [Gammaproteobacteria bacterium]